MSNVELIRPNNALCVEREELANRIAEYAERVRSGEIETDLVIIVASHPTLMPMTNCYGRRCTAGEAVGILTFAIADKTR